MAIHVKTCGSAAFCIERGGRGGVRPGGVTPDGPDGRDHLVGAVDHHSGELMDDLLQTAILTLADGRKFKPARWTGSGPVGHHREGVLSFDVPDPAPGSVELAITRPGESPRFYRWQR